MLSWQFINYPNTINPPSAQIRPSSGENVFSWLRINLSRLEKMTDIDKQSGKQISPLEGRIWAEGGILVLGKFIL